MDKKLKSILIDYIAYVTIGFVIVTPKFISALDNVYAEMRNAPRIEYLEMDVNNDGYIDRLTVTESTIISRLYDSKTQEFIFSPKHSVFDNKIHW